MEYKQGKLSLFNMDCMDLMKEYPDKYFDLAIVDPPYRNQNENQPTQDMRNTGTLKNFGDKPDLEYFKNLFRVSKNQIIWGANNFTEFLPSNKGFVIYKKKTITENFTMSMLEYAWVNNELSTVSKWVEIAPQDKYRIHPTQKPISLYSWILEKYAKPDFKILDTHLGSGSHAIACHYFGAEFVASELDSYYFKASIERIKKETSQLSLFEVV